MQISSADSTAGWSQAQWVAQARNGFQVAGLAGNGTNGEPYTSCISMAGSHIQNVRTGVIAAGNNFLFTNNVIDYFGDDGIDYAANNLAITHNTLHDNFEHRRRQPRRRDARAERPAPPRRRLTTPSRTS